MIFFKDVQNQLNDDVALSLIYIYYKYLYMYFFFNRKAEKSMMTCHYSFNLFIDLCFY